jgi:phosphatidylglycerophosphate synthase
LNLPSFLWLWRIAAWSIGLSIAAYVVLAATGLWMRHQRQQGQPRPAWLRPAHFFIGSTMVFLVLLLLAIGFVGTLGEYGRLGHSAHLGIGLLVVSLTLLSAWSAVQITPGQTWARSLHVGVNLALCVGFLAVSLTGWSVVQKYLP